MPRSQRAGRRRAIMHWVRNYTRKRDVTIQEVKEHLRGVHSFNFGTTLVEIFAPPFEAAFETTRVAKSLKKSGDLEIQNAKEHWDDDTQIPERDSLGD